MSSVSECINEMCPMASFLPLLLLVILFWRKICCLKLVQDEVGSTEKVHWKWGWRSSPTLEKHPASFPGCFLVFFGQQEVDRDPLGEHAQITQAMTAL